MELRKTNESVTRSYDAEGKPTDRVDSINYEVRDEEGNVIGSAYVNGNDAGLNVNIYGFGNVEEGAARLMKIFGVSE